MKSIQPHQRNIDWLEMYHDAPSITCLLRDAAAGVGVSDLMEVRLFIERSCEHVQEVQEEIHRYLHRNGR